MKESALGAWITLNENYYFGPFCDPGKLLDDASLPLDGAHGTTQSVADLLSSETDLDPDDLANALWTASTLIQMEQRACRRRMGGFKNEESSPSRPRVGWVSAA
jgi:hypothetical protein